jgi:DNA-binding NarL/FixJ family response regulator
MAITIALADDHQLVRKGIRLLLENIKDFKVLIDAADGRELIDRIEALAKKPDLVLVDVNMPVMSGQETVKYLRDQYPDLRIVALSVLDQLTVVREMIRLGANAYLFKDSSPETFHKVLLEVHNHGHYYDQRVIDSMMLHDSTHATKSAYQKKLGELTARELTFLNHCCSELTYKEIADRMGISLRTVDGYRDSLFDKLHLKSRTGLVLFAVESGLFKPEKK